MGTFNASLRTIGDRRGIPAVITVAERQLRIEAGDQEIGEWHLDEVVLEPSGESVYRLEVDGDRILIDFEDATSFRDLLASTSRMRGRAKVRPKRRRVEAPVQEPRPAKAPKEPKAKKEPKPKKEPKARDGSANDSGFLARVDGSLTTAEHRWGSLLPRWVFSRAMALGTAILLLTAIVLPGIVSVILLVAGLLLVLFGAVVYTDNMLASRWLPGRMTPMHVLLFGVTVLMLDVLLGVIA